MLVEVIFEKRVMFKDSPPKVIYIYICSASLLKNVYTYNIFQCLIGIEVQKVRIWILKR